MSINGILLSTEKEQNADRYTNLNESGKHYANTENHKISLRKLNIYINGKSSSVHESEEFYH